MANENFTIYTIVDVTGVLTVIASKITAVNCDRDIDAYAYKDWGVGFFDLLDIDFEFYLNSASLNGAWAGGPGFSNDVDDARAWGVDGIHSLGTKTGGGVPRIQFTRGGNVTSDYGVISQDTLYYCTLARAIGNDTASLYIYSDAPRTVLVDTLVIAGFGATKWRYSYGFTSANTGNAGLDMDGYVQNLDMNLVEVGAVWDFFTWG